MTSTEYCSRVGVGGGAVGAINYAIYLLFQKNDNKADSTSGNRKRRKSY
jgi:hypothetical protein